MYYHTNKYYQKPPRNNIHSIMRNINGGNLAQFQNSHIYNIKSLLQSVSTPQTSNIPSRENSVNLVRRKMLEKFNNKANKSIENNQFYSLGQQDKNISFNFERKHNFNKTNSNDNTLHQSMEGSAIQPLRRIQGRPPIRNPSDRTRYDNKSIQHKQAFQTDDDLQCKEEQLEKRNLSQKQIKKPMEKVQRHSFQLNDENQGQLSLNSGRNDSRCNVLKDITNLKFKCENSKYDILRKFENPAPLVSARAWALFDGNSHKLIDGRSQYLLKEIASLTKIMTFWTSLKIIDRLQLNISQLEFKVSKFASSVNGTSAKLKEGQILKIKDLFYGMMLPSGNDASLVLAEYLGCLLQLHQSFTNYSPQQQKYFIQKNVYDFNSFHKKLMVSINPVYTFINEMNVQAKDLGLSQTNFACTHGLSNKNNKSSAYDVAKMSSLMLENTLFAQVVSTQQYNCTIINEFGYEQQISWINTNKMLEKVGWGGIKTGITDPAGPCLASSYTQNSKKFILVLLNCKSMDVRWEESQKIVQWALKNPPRDFKNQQ